MPEELPIWLPFGFAEWAAPLQAVTLALLTFASEDVTTISAGVLTAMGTLSWTTGYLGCFLGIWLGDAGLYGISRGFGRPLAERSWARRFVNPDKLRKSEEWFATQGMWILAACRFMPGTRLATYLTAGFLRVPFGAFLWITGICAAVWTAGIFVLAGFLGEGALKLVNNWNTGGWIIVLTVVALVFLLWTLNRFFQRNGGRRLGILLGKIPRWEFWPPWIFYLPVGVHYLWLAIRYRGFTLPTAANPGLESGGFVGESKFATLKELSATSPELTVPGYYLPEGKINQRIHLVEEICKNNDMAHPFILKPDPGQRGAGIKLITSPEQVRTYLEATEAPLLLQPFAAGRCEAGIFYYRFPGEKRGKIFSITDKQFPVLTGDGASTLEQLVWKHPWVRFKADLFLNRFETQRTKILAKGETFPLVITGNHTQGCLFRDGWRLHTKALEDRIDEISRKLNGFFFGRYDVRYDSEEDLKRGENFKIIELNGATSEATSIYDPENSLWAAYRVLFRQWKLVFAIGAANRARGVPPAQLATLWKNWRAYRKLAASFPDSD